MDLSRALISSPSNNFKHTLAEEGDKEMRHDLLTKCNNSRVQLKAEYIGEKNFYWNPYQLSVLKYIVLRLKR